MPFGYPGMGGSVSPPGGGGGGNPFAGGQVPWWLPLALMGGSGIARTIGGRRDVNNRNAETGRQDAEQKRRAQARAALVSAVLKSQGYEGLIDEETLVNLYTRTGAREPQSSLFNTGASLLGNVGAGLITRNNTNTNPRGNSATFWEQFEREMANTGLIPSGARP